MLKILFEKAIYHDLYQSKFLACWMLAMKSVSVSTNARKEFATTEVTFDKFKN
jgi:hypothetical protein